MRFLTLVALALAALAAAPVSTDEHCRCHIYLVFCVDVNSVIHNDMFNVQMQSFMQVSLQAAIKQAGCPVKVVIIEFGAKAQMVFDGNGDALEAIKDYKPSMMPDGVSNYEAALELWQEQWMKIKMLSSSNDDEPDTSNMFVIGNNDFDACSSMPFGNCNVATIDGSEYEVAMTLQIRMKAGLYVFCPPVTTVAPPETTEAPTTPPDIPETTVAPTTPPDDPETTTCEDKTEPPPNPTDPPLPPGDKCFQCRQRRNHRDLYEDETDCHYYYQCFYVNATFAIGFRRKCPEGQFWHDPVLTCMPEGSEPCVDRCLSDDALHAKGCFPGSGCRQYFVCANTGSYGMCCPEGTSFVDATCSCDEDVTCTDFCSQQAPAIPTSVAPPTQVDLDTCVDSFGSTISAVLGEPNAYVLIGDDGLITEKKFCPDNLNFDLVTCRCNTPSDVTVPPPAPSRKATLVLTFDDSTKDLSVHNYETFVYDGADRDTTTAAVGGGSLAVNGGYLSIPGLKTFDFRNSGSWCAFFRGTGAGGILSNNKDSVSSEYTVVYGTQSSTSFLGKLKFWHPVGLQTVQSAFTTPASGWNHFCGTYDGNAARLYMNGALVDTVFVGGYLSVAHCPYVVGTDQDIGTYNGNVDEVLITPFAMTEDDIQDHFTGNTASLRAKGFW